MATSRTTLTDVVIPRIENDPLVARVSDAVEQLAGGFTIDPDSVLRAGLLGHSVHPVLTDVPMGAWLSTSLLDLFGGVQARPAAEKLLTVGIVTALPTAATGAADMLSLGTLDRRVALVHALGNDVALVLFIASRRARRKDRYRLGTVLALAGNGLSAASGFLGGHLALKQSTGSGESHRLHHLVQRAAA